MTEVALVTDHLSVADWPRSTVVGSTVNETMFGRPMDSFGLVAGPSVGVGTAARGGTFGFLLHPTPSAAIKTITPSTPQEFIVNIKILSRLCMKLLTPNWLFVLPLISKPCYCSRSEE